MEPLDSGWSVALFGKPLQVHAAMDAAIDAATDLARARHDATGEPTGVRLAEPGDVSELIALHG